MAHKVKIGTSVQAGAKLILQRPSLAALLGAVAAEWASLESSVMHLYAFLMGVYLPQAPPGFEPPSHPVAYQVFDTLPTLHLRLELLRKLAEWFTKDAALLEELTTTIKAIRKAAELRNKLVHAHWGVTAAAEYNDALILLPIFGDQLAYRESDFNHAIDKIMDAEKAVCFFHAKARDLEKKRLA